MHRDVALDTEIIRSGVSLGCSIRPVFRAYLVLHSHLLSSVMGILTDLDFSGVYSEVWHPPNPKIVWGYAKKHNKNVILILPGRLPSEVLPVPLKLGPCGGGWHAASSECRDYFTIGTVLLIKKNKQDICFPTHSETVLEV